MEAEEAPQKLTRYQRYGAKMNEYNKRYRKERMASDPDYAEHVRRKDADNKYNRYHTDPEYKAKIQQRNVENYYKRQLKKLMAANAAD